MRLGKVLIIDDNLDHRNAIQFLLQKEKYIVFSAKDGVIGLELLSKHNDIGVVIVDLAMLELPGVEVLKALKDWPFPLRRIVLTAHDEELHFADAPNLKVFSYLNKPISKHILLFTVKSAFNDLYLKELERELGIAKQWEELGQITADFVHLVGNKVGIIPNYIEAIREELSDVPSNIQSKFERMNEIADQIVTLKKVLLTPFAKAEMEVVNIKELIERTLAFIKPPEEIEVKKNYNAIENPVVYCNSAQLGKVIEDVVRNAVDAMKEAETRELTITMDESHNKMIRIRVHDTGCGISNENKEKIFRPFFTTKKEGNYGLGLFAAKNALAKFGGTIKYYTNAETGTIFEINLPLYEEKKSETSAEPERKNDQ